MSDPLRNKIPQSPFPRLLWLAEEVGLFVNTCEFV
jgi:hypothetical protein